MAARTIPDGAGITSHFSASFAPHVSEAGFTQVTGIGDEIEVVDGPDARGYVTGRGTRKDATLVIPSHDPASGQMHAWKDKCENGALGHAVTGTVSVLTAGDEPVAIWELTNCICKMVETSDLNLEGAEVSVETFTVSYARAKRIGP